MALTRNFKKRVAARLQRDTHFREALFTEAINAYLGGDPAAGKAILRDLINATVGFEGLAAEIKKPSKSLHRIPPSFRTRSIHHQNFMNENSVHF